MKKTAILLILLLLLVKVAAAAWPTDYAGMRGKAITFAGRLLCLLEKAAPYIILIFIVLGGLKYIMADDPGEILAARQMIMNAVVGGLCVLLFIAVASTLKVHVNCESCSKYCESVGYKVGVCVVEESECKENGWVYKSGGNGQCGGNSNAKKCCCASAEK